jgi:hypothetical protein
MLPREFDPNNNHCDSSSNEQMASLNTVIDLGQTPGDLTIKKDDECPRWTLKHTVKVVCLVAAGALIVWGFVR